MLVILMPDCTQHSVINAINSLTSALGIRTFKKYFPVILTDNGSEFKNPWDIEKTESGIHRTYPAFFQYYTYNSVLFCQNTLLNALQLKTYPKIPHSWSGNVLM